MNQILKAYLQPILLLIAIICGTIIGLLIGPKAEILKPLGDIFLNLMFTVVVPLVFFSISSAVGNMNSLSRLGKIMGVMMLVFVITGIIASLLMLFSIALFPFEKVSTIQIPTQGAIEKVSLSEQIVKALTVSDFYELLSRKSMLALIILSILVGYATLLAGEKAKPFVSLLNSGFEVMMKLVGIIMWYAPIGLGAYFAYLIGVFGPQLLGTYYQSIILYYPVSIIYFFAGFTIYAYLAGGRLCIQTFWKNILPPAATSLATGSSVAAIPTNLRAAQKAGVPKDISELIIPMGATIHMDGSCLSAILKIAFLFSVFNMPFNTLETFGVALGIALLSSLVMSGIPGGGFIAELLIVSLYGFPPEALPMLAVIGTLVDPPATLVNAAGDNVASMLVTRWVEGKNWMKSREPE